MFLKLHFIMLIKDYQHVKNELLYVELEVGRMCWTNLCKVWHMKITWRKSFNLSKFSTYSKRESPTWIWKYEGFVGIPSNDFPQKH